jgi:hypothetical protein
MNTPQQPSAAMKRASIRKLTSKTAVICSLLAAFVGGCQSPQPSATSHESDPPIFLQSLPEIDQTIRKANARYPDPPARIVALARKNLGQPYEIYLLGEAPFETIDDQPVFTFQKSDCVVFVEHTLAMALTDDLPSMLAMLQRIRYRDGQISLITRNHYTEADWNPNNRWLVRDISADIGGDATASYSIRVDSARFFQERYKLETDVPVRMVTQSYVPSAAVLSVADRLRPGDIVQFVRGKGDSRWIGHFGFISSVQPGEVRVIHSASPAVREETLAELATGKNLGFAFLRLVDDPIASLRAIDGPEAPRVAIPSSSPVSWDTFVQQTLHPHQRQ